MSVTSTRPDLKPYITTISYKQASIGVILSIAFGYGLTYLGYFLDSMFNWGIMNFFSDLYLIQVSPPSQLYFVTLGFIFLTDIPACCGWFFGGLILGIYSKSKNANYNGVKGSWKSFQIVIMAIELMFIGSALYYTIGYGLNLIPIPIFPSFMPTSLLFGGLILYLFTFFITPGFWLSLAFVLLGGIIGSKAVKGAEIPPPKKVPKIVREAKPKPAIPKPAVAKPAVAKPAIPKPAVAKPAVAKPAIPKPAVAKPKVTKPEVTKPKVVKPAVKPTPPIKVEKAEVSVKVPVKKPPIVAKVKVTEEDRKVTEEVLRTKKCPKCKKPFQRERLKLIEMGKDTFCPGCLKVIKGKVTKQETKSAEVKKPPLAADVKKNREEILEIIKVGDDLASEDKEKAHAFYEDALDIAKKIKAKDLIIKIEEKIRKITR